MNKNWYAVLTADVLYDTTLTNRQKLLVAIISNLSNEKGYCYASNEYLSKTLGCSTRSIQRDLNILEKKHIQRKVFYKENNEIDYRTLSPLKLKEGLMTPVSPPYDTSVTTPNDTGVTIITKNNNNKVNNIPGFEEFKKYAIDKKGNVCLESLKLKYESWVENGWKSGKDKKIKNWKSTLLNTLPYIKEKSSAKKEKDNRSADQIILQKYGIE